MSRFCFRNLGKYRTGGSGDLMHLSVPLPKTADGKVSRACPDEDCMPGVFQLGDPLDPRPETAAHRRVRQPGAPGTTCPYCGNSADDDGFTSPEDMEAALREVKWAVQKDVSEFMQGMAADFNRRMPRNSLIGIRMDVKPGHHPRPRAYRQDLLRDLCCDACGRRYGVFAIGLFCPDCAAPNLLTHFTRELELITEQIALAEAARKEGKVELAFRLLGNAHEDVLTSFETYLKTVHRHLARAAGVAIAAGKTNRFQNIERARKAFAEVGVDPFVALGPDDLEFLRLNIEKRHIVGHNLGLIDEHFAEAARDGKPGHVVELRADDVTRFAEECRRVIETLDGQLVAKIGEENPAPARGGDVEDK